MTVWHPGIGKEGGHNRGFGGVASSRQRIFAIFLYTTLISAHLIIEKVHAVSTVTMDNAKIFSQLMSTSRSFAKISERRLQPLLV